LAIVAVSIVLSKLDIPSKAVWVKPAIGMPIGTETVVIY
jgi:hypothetical protein